jgi:Tfp pilus assembly protein PilF
MTGRVISILGLLFIGACAHPPYEPRVMLLSKGPLLTYDEHIELATIYEARGETGLALREYKKAARFDESHSFPYFAMGNIYLARGYYIEAEENYLKAIELDPNVGVFYNNLGWLYIETHRLIMADSMVRQGLVNDLGRRYIYLDTLGVIEMRLRNFGEAERLLNEALVVAPVIDTAALFHIHTHLLELYIVTGDEKKADEAKRRIKELKRFEPFFPYPR